MPATPSEIDVVPPTLPGFSSPVPVTVRIRNLVGADATTYTTFNGSTAHPVAARITTTTSFFFEGNINSGPWVVTCTTDGGQVVASQTLLTGPIFNPGVVQCGTPLDATSSGIVAVHPPTIWPNAGAGSIGLTGGSVFASFAATGTTTAGAWVPASALSGWSTFAIDILSTLTTADTGGCVWRVDLTWATTGDNVTNATETIAQATQTYTAGTSLQRTFRYTSGRAVVADKDLSLRVFRLGDDGADTLTAAALLTGIRLVRQG